MKCPNCQTVNPQGARFCMNCGSNLAFPCPNCGTQLPGGARFCTQCGYQIGATPPVTTMPVVSPTRQTPADLADSSPSIQPAPVGEDRVRHYLPTGLESKLEAARASHSKEGERRIVTILFCDVTGSTSMAEKLDPEEWTVIMNQAFERLIAPVYRYEGTVARLMGDAILAFFGAPLAHEDDPQRAILAGLDILAGIQDFRRQLSLTRGLDFNVRVGINTGLVVVGAVGSDLRVEYTAMGDAVNLAARMEQTAAPGTVQITEDTYRLVANQFEFEALGGIEVKGKAESMPAYRVLNKIEGQAPTRGIAGLHSALVGRQEELSLLQGHIDRLRQGHGQIVSVIGEAGLGKSRLLTELRAANSGNGHPREVAGRPQASTVLWVMGRSLSYETSTPYAPFVDLFSEIFGLSRGDPQEARYEQVKARAEAMLPGQGSHLAPFLASLLGILPIGEDLEKVRYLEPPQLRERIFRAVQQFFEGLASRRPVVLVFDDLHWVDHTSLELLGHLMPLTERCTLMLIALFRPQRRDLSWSYHERAGREYGHRYTALTLEPLDEPSSRQLVSNLLYIENLPEEVRVLILRKAEGNPFFVEEVIRTLLENRLVVRENSHWRATGEIRNISVPNSLAGVITARLDRLDEAAKRVIQTAAVIGREFGFDLLAQVHGEPAELEEALADLQRRDLVRELNRLPRRVYTFKHVLTQETAYASLLLRRRRALHRAVAEMLIDSQPEAVNDIARHYLEAQEKGLALPYLVEAGDRAARAYAVTEAIGYFRQALEILPERIDLKVNRRAYEGLGSVLTFANDIPAAVETYQAMYQLAKDKDDVPMQVSALNKLSTLVAMRLGQFPEAEQLLSNAEQLARQYGDKAGLAEMFMVRCGLCTAAGDFDGAVNYLGESVQIGRELDIKEQMAVGLVHIANTQSYMTRFEESWVTSQEALRISEEIGNRELKAGVLTFAVPMFHIRNGDLQEARRSAELGFGIAEQIGALMPLCDGSLTLGYLSGLAGDYEIAIQWNLRSLQAAQQLGMAFMEVIPLCALGSLYLEISPKLRDRFQEYRALALKKLEEPGGFMGGGSGWADLGFCALALGEQEKARQYFNQGLQVPTPQSLLRRPLYLVGLASLALSDDDLDGAADYLVRARQFVEEKAMRNYRPLVSLAEGRLLARRGEWGAAMDRLAEAARLAGIMKLRPLAWQAQAEAGRLQEQLGRLEEARDWKNQAAQTVEEIASLFQDLELRALFNEAAPAAS